MIEQIPNEALRRDNIPSDDAPWPDVFAFALSFDGYGKLGGTGPCGEIANEAAAHFRGHGTVQHDLDLSQLRGCLFFEQRRWHHFGNSPDESARTYFAALLGAIRERVA